MIRFNMIYLEASDIPVAEVFAQLLHLHMNMTMMILKRCVHNHNDTCDGDEDEMNSN